MPDDNAGRRPQGFFTRLSHSGRAGDRVHGFVNPPLMRGSTVLYPSCADRIALGKRRLDQELIYGLLGGPTHFALEDMIAEIEGGTRCQIVSSGLAAVTTPLLAFLGAGDHCLIPDSVYGPTRSFASGMLTRLGVETSYYPPEIDAASLTTLIRPNTKVLFLESPGSHTFEMQDVPALAEAAHARGLKVLLDNTWGLHFFQPFRHGVDVSIQALTKYALGHSDALLGAVTTADAESWEHVRLAALQLGQYASPDDCWLAIRGLRTLGVRLARQMESGLVVAEWLAARPEVHQVLHPALPGAPGHALWKRDFSGAPSLFGVVFAPRFSAAATRAMIDGLELFGIGASWGGYESLALPTTGFVTRTAEHKDFGGPMIRLHIGLEDPADLIADLERGLALLAAYEDAG
ncbi:MAG TPA: cystathionine beta-lyase [Acetobacteraceae bacterium]|nr:cystathionine beta-lyase [Acetobacteraceae bacterium]